MCIRCSLKELLGPDCLAAAFQQWLFGPAIRSRFPFPLSRPAVPSGLSFHVFFELFLLLKF